MCRHDRLHGGADAGNRALLLLAFASGGRRRSEVARLRVEPLIPQDPVPAHPEDPDSPKLACVAVQVGRTKTGVADEDRLVLLIGRSADALLAWLVRAKISTGAVFRGINRWGHTREHGSIAPGDEPDPEEGARLAGLDGLSSVRMGCGQGT